MPQYQTSQRNAPAHTRVTPIHTRAQSDSIVNLGPVGPAQDRMRLNRGNTTGHQAPLPRATFTGLETRSSGALYRGNTVVAHVSPTSPTIAEMEEYIDYPDQNALQRNTTVAGHRYMSPPPPPAESIAPSTYSGQIPPSPISATSNLGYVSSPVPTGSINRFETRPPSFTSNVGSMAPSYRSQPPPPPPSFMTRSSPVSRI